jgi:hypothetical protein
VSTGSIIRNYGIDGAPGASRRFLSTFVRIEKPEVGGKIRIKLAPVFTVDRRTKMVEEAGKIRLLARVKGRGGLLLGKKEAQRR